MLTGILQGRNAKERTLHSVLQKTPDARASQFDKTAVETVTEDLGTRLECRSFLGSWRAD